MAVEEAARSLVPLPEVDAASEHEGVVARDVVDVVELPHVDVDPVRGELGADPCRDLRRCAMFARRSHQDCHLAPAFPREPAGLGGESSSIGAIAIATGRSCVREPRPRRRITSR